MGERAKVSPMTNNIPHAKALRTRQTPAEQHLWYHLRAHRFLGLKFKRQKPIGPYIVDFVCMGHALVIELDGSQHGDQIAYDRERDAWLASQGFTVLRFWNHEALDQTDSVLERIRQFVETAPSPPTPLPQAGEGSQAHPSLSTHTMMLTWLALGDSYTIGEGVPAEGRWPVQLAAALRGEGVPLADPEILATTGWTTDELSAAMDAAGYAPPWDLVSLLIGVNNQYRGRSVDDYRDEFRRLLQRAIALAGARAGCVLVLSIPDWGVTPFARDSGRDTARIAAELDAYNATARAETLRFGAHWVDITPISRAHPALLADDALHPAAAQYTLWMEAALPTARAMLAKR